MQIDINANPPEYGIKISGVSYIGNPQSNTAMYISKKVAAILGNLESVENCLVFAEDGIDVPCNILSNNCFVFSDSPQREYAKYVTKMADSVVATNNQRKTTLTPKGYYIGENVSIGKGAYVEQNCIIGHDVKIGKNAYIMAGTIIKNATIGDNFISNEYAVIGAYGFTMINDDDGNKIRIPTLGKVHIGNNVEIGAHDNVSCGSAGSTVIDDNAKIDALVHIGHDAHIGRNTEITAGSIIGGFVDTGENVFVGINSSVRNRKTIGNNTIIGMGSVVVRNIEKDCTVVGNPAEPMVK